jgi:outer membrane lipoprotein-sorting protein
MSTLWYLLILGILGQNPQSPNPVSPEKKAESEKKDSSKAQAPQEIDPETEHDKFIKMMAEKLAKVVDVAAEIYYGVRNQDRWVETTGSYKLGPQNRMRFELTFTEGGVTGKRLYVSDGTDSYHIQEFGDSKRGQHFKLDKVRPLIEDKSMAPEERDQIFRGIVPFQKPDGMLKGYLSRMTFTERKEEKLGDRDVITLQGRWKKSTVQLLVNGDPKKGFDDIDPSLPRFIKLVLDKETGWPLQVELYQKIENVGVFKPILSLKFSKLTIGKRVAESEFKFVPPQNIQMTDMTPMLEAGLKRKLEANAAQEAAKKAAGEPTKDAKKPDSPPSEK